MMPRYLIASLIIFLVNLLPTTVTAEANTSIVNKLKSIRIDITDDSILEPTLENIVEGRLNSDLKSIRNLGVIKKFQRAHKTTEIPVFTFSRDRFENFSRYNIHRTGIFVHPSLIEGGNRIIVKLYSDLRQGKLHCSDNMCNFVALGFFFQRKVLIENFF